MTVGDELRLIARAFLYRWWIVALAVLVVLGLGIAHVRTTTPLYRAVTEIMIDPRGRRLFEREIVPTGLGSSASGVADALLTESQVEIILSRSVLGSVVASQRLHEDPEFVTTGESGPVRRMARSVVRGPQAPPSVEDPFESALATLHQHLVVRRKGNTYVLSIAVLSADPQKAAQIANAIAAAYVAEANRVAAMATRDVFSVLSSRLDELREESEQAERAVAEYRFANNLAGGGQEATLVEQELRATNEQLGLARNEAGTALARWEQAVRLGAGGDPQPGGQTAPGQALQGQAPRQPPQALHSELLASLRLKLSELNSREAGLGRTMMANHPAVAAVQREREAVEAGIRAETDRILGGLRLDYDSAAARVASLERRLEELQAKVLTVNIAAIEMRQLQREADAARAVFETLMSRAKEAQEQIGVPSDTTRVISTAIAPHRPALPAVSLVLIASLAAGTGLGLAIAWIGHLLNGTPPPRRRRRAPVEPDERAPSPAVRLDAYAGAGKNHPAEVRAS